MSERAGYNKKNPAFQPLYRPPDHKAAERIMNKYVSAHIWYKQMDLGDPYRQMWKRRIKSKT